MMLAAMLFGADKPCSFFVGSLNTGKKAAITPVKQLNHPALFLAHYRYQIMALVCIKTDGGTCCQPVCYI